MDHNIVASQRMPFSVLFPGVHQMAVDALSRQFYALQLRCVKTLLAVCAERLTRYAVAMPVRPNMYQIPYLTFRTSTE